MVPGLRWGELSFSSLFEYISIISVLERDVVRLAGFLLSAYEGPLSGERLPRQKVCFRRIRGSEHDGELVVGYPSFCPVDFWLGGCEPWVSEDDFVVA
jgi:hypothetical protein